MEERQKVFITATFPHSSGNIHLGHLLGHIQADIYARFRRLRGDKVYFCSGESAHGSIISWNTEYKKDPMKGCEKKREEHLADLKAFGMSYDNYHITHSEETKYFLDEVFEALDKKGSIQHKDSYDFYDRRSDMYLSANYIRANCPKCGAKNQYGDTCTSCNSDYEPIEAVKPVSRLTGDRVLLAKNLHYFISFQRHKGFLKSFIGSGVCDDNDTVIAATHFTSKPVIPEFQISRTGPYFGILMKNDGWREGNRYYRTWLDSMVGYLASLKALCPDATEFKSILENSEDSGAIMINFMCRDSAYQHLLIWPVVLQSLGYKMPNAIISHGLLQVDGLLMSKDKGNLVTAKSYLNSGAPAEALRLFFAEKSNSESRVRVFEEQALCDSWNSIVMNHFLGAAELVFSYMKYFDYTITEEYDTTRCGRFVPDASLVESGYLGANYKFVLFQIRRILDYINSRVRSPSFHTVATRGDAEDKAMVNSILAEKLNSLRCVAIFLKPIMPELVAKFEKLLNVGDQQWCDVENHLKVGHKIRPWRRISKRIDVRKEDVRDL